MPPKKSSQINRYLLYFDDTSSDDESDVRNYNLEASWKRFRAAHATNEVEQNFRTIRKFSFLTHALGLMIFKSAHVQRFYTYLTKKFLSGTIVSKKAELRLFLRKAIANAVQDTLFIPIIPKVSTPVMEEFMNQFLKTHKPLVDALIDRLLENPRTLFTSARKVLENLLDTETKTLKEALLKHIKFAFPEAIAGVTRKFLELPEISALEKNVNLTGALEKEILKYKSELFSSGFVQRKTLGRSAHVFDLSHVVEDFFPKFLATLLVSNKSTKRMVRGACHVGKLLDESLVRQWIFPMSESPVLDLQGVTVNGVRKDEGRIKVECSGGTYTQLSSLLSKYSSKLNQSLRQAKRPAIEGRDVAHWMHQCLSGKNLLEYGNGTLLQVDDHLLLLKVKQLITKVAYLIFGSESVRNPASLVYAAMMFDLMEEGHIQIADIPKYFPMAMKGAVLASVSLEDFYSLYMPAIYKYDKRKTRASKEKVLELVNREDQLFRLWLSSKSSDVDAIPIHVMISFMDEVVKRWYGISVNGESKSDISPLTETYIRSEKPNVSWWPRLSSERSEIPDVLRYRGFSDVPADGFCFYHAVVSAYHTGFNAAELHNHSLQHILNNPETYIDFVPGILPTGIQHDNPVEAMGAYINLQLASPEYNPWADALMIHATSHVIGQPIQVQMFSATGEPVVLENGQHSILSVGVGDGNPIVLGNIANMHFVYQSHPGHPPALEILPAPNTSHVSHSSTLVGADMSPVLLPAESLIATELPAADPCAPPTSDQCTSAPPVSVLLASDSPLPQNVVIQDVSVSPPHYASADTLASNSVTGDVVQGE